MDGVVPDRKPGTTSSRRVLLGTGRRWPGAGTYADSGPRLRPSNSAVNRGSSASFEIRLRAVTGENLAGLIGPPLCGIRLFECGGRRGYCRGP